MHFKKYFLVIKKKIVLFVLFKKYFLIIKKTIFYVLFCLVIKLTFSPLKQMSKNESKFNFFSKKFYLIVNMNKSFNQG